MNIGDYVKINNLLIGMIIDNTVRDYRDRYDDSALRIYYRPAVIYCSSYARRLVNECNKIMRNDKDFPDTTYKSKCLPHCTTYYKEISKKIYKTRM